MNVAHPDDMDEDVADDDGTQESENRGKRPGNAPHEIAPNRERTVNDPIIVNKIKGS